MRKVITLGTCSRGAEPQSFTRSLDRAWVRTRALVTTLLIGIATLTLTSGSSLAWSCADNALLNSSFNGRVVDVRVLSGEQALPLYRSPRGDARRYFEATQGREYAIELRNTTNRRIGVLVAVDGLNVISGQRSKLAAGEAMYVLDPWGRTVIRGWRTSLSDIRHFVFVDEQRSYASRTGQANGDLGWVRVLAFREVQPEAWRGWFKPGSEPREDGRPNAGAPQPLDQRAGGDAAKADGGRDEAGAQAPTRELAKGEASPQSAPSTSSNDALARRKDADVKSLEERESAQSNPGTGWGRQGYDPVHEVEFNGETWATDQLVLRYEYPGGLMALGIRPMRNGQRTTDRDHGYLGFAQAPTW